MWEGCNTGLSSLCSSSPAKQVKPEPAVNIDKFIISISILWSTCKLGKMGERQEESELEMGIGRDGAGRDMLCDGGTPIPATAAYQA
jgi:hypothetical protein